MGHTGPVRDWLVAGGIIRGADGLLLVQNRRRNGSLDWSTPGGVIDEGETLLEGLGREVREETGIEVARWAELAYEIDVEFVDAAMTLRVETHVAGTWTGELAVEDPDGIVVDAAFTRPAVVPQRLGGAPQWVREPLVSWLDDPSVEVFRYVVRGARPDAWSVERR